jgi:lysozyme family protein
MQERFDRCLDAVLGFEGGFVNDSRDPGGATKFGVTRAVLGEALERPATIADVQALTRDGAAAIYRRRYWTVTGCDHLPAGVDLLTFDTAVNMGPAVAGRFLQQAAGTIADGIVGPQTTAAVNAKDPRAIIESVSAYRGARYRALAGFEVFGKGWLKRLAAVTALALADAQPAPDFGGDFTRKALEA